jgi:hypothetical protein
VRAAPTVVLLIAGCGGGGTRTAAPADAAPAAADPAPVVIDARPAADAPSPGDAAPERPPAPDAAPSERPAADAAPGACRGTFLRDDFESGDDGGWSHAKLEPQMGDPWVRGSAVAPGCHGGERCWTVSLMGDYANCQEAALTSPPVDLSACAAGGPVQVAWWQWIQTDPFAEGKYWDSGLVQISRDDGATWDYLAATPGPQPPYTGVSMTHDDGCKTSLPYISGKRVWTERAPALATWHQASFVVPDTHRTARFRVRFVFGSDFRVTGRGWLIDDLTVGVAP